jgi:hypothetical protein
MKWWSFAKVLPLGQLEIRNNIFSSNAPNLSYLFEILNSQELSLSQVTLVDFSNEQIFACYL